MAKKRSDPDYRRKEAVNKVLDIACNTHYFIGYQGGAQFMSCRLGCLLSLVVGSRTMLLHVCRTSMANLAYIG